MKPEMSQILQKANTPLSFHLVRPQQYHEFHLQSRIPCFPHHLRNPACRPVWPDRPRSVQSRMPCWSPRMGPGLISRFTTRPPGSPPLSRQFHQHTREKEADHSSRATKPNPSLHRCRPPTLFLSFLKLRGCSPRLQIVLPSLSSGVLNLAVPRAHQTPIPHSDRRSACHFPCGRVVGRPRLNRILPLLSTVYRLCLPPPQRSRWRTWSHHILLIT